MAWCHQATSHYLHQCWARLCCNLLSVTRPQCLLNLINQYHTTTKWKLCAKYLECPVSWGYFLWNFAWNLIPSSLPELWFFWSEKIMRILPVPIQKSSSLHQQWLDFINKWYVLLIFFPGLYYWNQNVNNWSLLFDIFCSLLDAIIHSC